MFVVELMFARIKIRKMQEEKASKKSKHFGECNPSRHVHEHLFLSICKEFAERPNVYDLDYAWWSPFFFMFN